MPLTPQERSCIELARPIPRDLYGNGWAMEDGPTPDDLNSVGKSPDVIVTNGNLDAAIEVKRLVGNENSRGLKEAMHSLPRILDPGCRGSFILLPALDVRAPFDKSILKVLRDEVREVAPKLKRGETGGLKLQRSSWVALESEHGIARVHCCHNAWEFSNRMFEDLPGLRGSFLLCDNELPAHTFVTEDAIQHFRSELVAACRRRLDPDSPIDSNHFSWYEEIPLYRCEEDDDPGLEIIGLGEAEHVDVAVLAALAYSLPPALAKFQNESWAARHVVVFEQEDGFCTVERVKKLLPCCEAEMDNIDLVIMVAKDEGHIVWQSPRTVNRREPPMS